MSLIIHGELKSILIRNDSIVEQSTFLKTDSAYRINFGLLIPGVYKVKVEIEKGGQQLKREKDLSLKKLKWNQNICLQILKD